MSLRPQAHYVVPMQTEKVARTVFSQGTLCLTMADTLSKFINDATFSDLFEVKGQPAASPWRLAFFNHSSDIKTKLEG